MLKKKGDTSLKTSRSLQLFDVDLVLKQNHPRPMIIRRWQAREYPTLEQMKLIMNSEGLEPVEETFEPGFKLDYHRHPFDEVRVVIKGQLLYDINGTKLLLREGDRIQIPSNTKHSKTVQGDETCVSLMARAIFHS